MRGLCRACFAVAAGSLAALAFALQIADKLFGSFDAQAGGDDLLEERQLLASVLDAAQDLGVGLGNLAQANSVLDFLGQIQEMNQIRDRGAAQPQALSKLIVRHLVAIEVILETLGLFDRVEI